jgi:hypothetical protein
MARLQKKCPAEAGQICIVGVGYFDGEGAAGAAGAGAAGAGAAGAGAVRVWPTVVLGVVLAEWLLSRGQRNSAPITRTTAAIAARVPMPIPSRVVRVSRSSLMRSLSIIACLVQTVTICKRSTQKRRAQRSLTRGASRWYIRIRLSTIMAKRPVRSAARRGELFAAFLAASFRLWNLSRSFAVSNECRVPRSGKGRS